MITRFVKLNFTPAYCKQFEINFPEVKLKVEANKGCKEVKLFKAANCVYFTVSKWETEDDLNAYRNTDFFKQTWAIFKANFSAKAEAWTTNEIT